VDRMTRRDLLKAGAAGLGAAALAPAASAPEGGEVYAFHLDHVIGTSLDLCVAARDEGPADAALRVVLDEVERLRQILSLYDPVSEVSRLNRTRGPVAVSPELAAVLRAYDFWQRATGGAFAGHLGELARAWRDAEAAGELPKPEALARLARDLRSPVWRIDPAEDVVERTSDRPLDLNALGKACIIERAAAAVRRA
jgi:thiamine biosynthesis lipoprotein